MAGGYFPGSDAPSYPARGGVGTGSFPGSDTGSFEDRGDVDGAADYPGASDGSDAGGGGDLLDNPVLTSVGNGFVQGTNFDEATSSGDVETILTALGLSYHGTATLVESTYKKVARITPYDIGGGLGYIFFLSTITPALPKARMRLVMRMTGFDWTVNNGLWSLLAQSNVTTDSTHADGIMDGTVDLTVYSSGDSNQSDQLTDDTVSGQIFGGDWVEVILESIYDGANTTGKFYVQPVGDPRVSAVDPAYAVDVEVDTSGFTFSNIEVAAVLEIAVIEWLDADGVDIADVGT